MVLVGFVLSLSKFQIIFYDKTMLTNDKFSTIKKDLKSSKNIVLIGLERKRKYVRLSICIYIDICIRTYIYIYVHKILD